MIFYAHIIPGVPRARNIEKCPKRRSVDDKYWACAHCQSVWMGDGDCWLIPSPVSALTRAYQEDQK